MTSPLIQSHQAEKKLQSERAGMRRPHVALKGRSILRRTATRKASGSHKTGSFPRGLLSLLLRLCWRGWRGGKVPVLVAGMHERSSRCLPTTTTTTTRVCSRWDRKRFPAPRRSAFAAMPYRPLRFRSRDCDGQIRAVQQATNSTHAASPLLSIIFHTHTRWGVGEGDEECVLLIVVASGNHFACHTV